MGIWRVGGGTRPQGMAVRSITVFNSTPSGNKLVGILYRMGMKSVSKFIGVLVVKSQLFKLIECMFCVTRSTNAQKNGMKYHSFCTDKESSKDQGPKNSMPDQGLRPCAISLKERAVPTYEGSLAEAIRCNQTQGKERFA
eukprot:1156396-Pelagomonas_calceolata.AAC.1